MMQCSALHAELTPLLLEAAALTDFAVLFRYTDAPREPHETEAESGLAVAQRVFHTISVLIG
jgi:hypothetical protein